MRMASLAHSTILGAREQGVFHEDAGKWSNAELLMMPDLCANGRQSRLEESLALAPELLASKK
jgi:hypothetical protein